MACVDCPLRQFAVQSCQVCPMIHVNLHTQKSFRHQYNVLHNFNLDLTLLTSVTSFHETFHCTMFYPASMMIGEYSTSPYCHVNVVCNLCIVMGLTGARIEQTSHDMSGCLQRSIFYHSMDGQILNINLHLAN